VAVERAARGGVGALRGAAGDRHLGPRLLDERVHTQLDQHYGAIVLFSRPADRVMAP
jgi:hypothetical protein